MKNKILFCTILLSSIANLYSQNGPLDLTFSTDGKVTTKLDSSNCGAGALAIQADGKIVIAGNASWSNGWVRASVLLRYNSDGSVDSSFGINGKVITYGNITYAGVAIQTDGKIVAVGGNEIGQVPGFLVARYNLNGSLDSSFGSNGITTTIIDTIRSGAHSVVIRTDGKIIVGGYNYINQATRYALACYNTNGVIDSTFATNGIFREWHGNRDGFVELVLKPNGQVIGVGSMYDSNSDYYLEIIQLNLDGSLDFSFGTSGMVRYQLAAGGHAYTVALQQNGKIILGGYVGIGSNPEFGFLLARFNSDGSSIDNTFGNNGIVKIGFGTTNAMANSVVVQSDDKIVAVGSANGAFGIARCNVNGALDNTFDTDGKYTTDFFGEGAEANAVVMQQDGRIVVAGSTTQAGKRQFAVARYLSGLNLGIINFSVENNSLLIYPNPLMQNAILEYTLNKEETLSISLFDMQGKLIKAFATNEKQEAGEHKQQLVMPVNLTSGSYLITLSTINGQVSVKVVK